MAALQMAIAVIALAALALGGLVPFLAVLLYMHSYVHAFLHGMAFCITCTAETYAYPNARPNPWRALTGNKYGFCAWIQQAVRADRRLALSRQ